MISARAEVPSVCVAPTKCYRKLVTAHGKHRIRTVDALDETTVDEAVLTVPMRCYYPDQFIRRITDHGFSVIACWGGHAGEAYGVGPELVVQFERAA